MGVVLAVIAGGWVMLGRELQAANAPLGDLERAADEPGAGEPTQYYLARRLLESGRVSEAYAAFSQGAERYPNSERLLEGEALALVDARRWDDCERRVTAWPPRLREKPPAQMALARVMLDGRKRPDRAAELLEKVVKADPKQADAYYQLGRAYAAMYRPKDSQAAFRKAVSLTPARAEYHREFGQSFVYDGKLPEALSEITQARQLAPADPMTNYLYGRLRAALATGPQDRAEAKYALLMAESGSPAVSEIQCELGQLEQSAKAYKEASRRYERCLELDPSHADAVYRLAQVYFRADRASDGERAMKAYDTVRTLVRPNSHAFASGGYATPASTWKQLSRCYRSSGFAHLANIAAERAGGAPGLSGASNASPATPPVPPGQ